MPEFKSKQWKPLYIHVAFPQNVPSCAQMEVPSLPPNLPLHLPLSPSSVPLSLPIIVLPSPLLLGQKPPLQSLHPGIRSQGVERKVVRRGQTLNRYGDGDDDDDDDDNIKLMTLMMMIMMITIVMIVMMMVPTSKEDKEFGNHRKSQPD